MDDRQQPPPPGALPLRAHASADSAAVRESSFGSARTADSGGGAREAWARHPYYSSQEDQHHQSQQMYQPLKASSGGELKAKGSRSKRDGSRKHRGSKTSKHSSGGVSASGGSGEVGLGSGATPSNKQLHKQIEQNRDAMMARQKELKKQDAARAYRAMRENTAAAPSLAALLMVCIWISLVSGFSILAFGWIFNVFVQATPFFYVSLGTGSSLVLLGSFLAAFRSKTPPSVAFGV